MGTRNRADLSSPAYEHRSRYGVSQAKAQAKKEELEKDVQFLEMRNEN